MTALLTAARTGHQGEGCPTCTPPVAAPTPRPELRLVQGGRRRPAAVRQTRVGALPPARPATRRRVSPEVRRRRTLLALMGLGVAVLALPLGGSGGGSHTAGSAAAAIAAGTTYTVESGDTLWSIAQRVDPSGDPRPLVERMAAEIGTYQVVPGEHVAIP